MLRDFGLVTVFDLGVALLGRAPGAACGPGLGRGRLPALHDARRPAAPPTAARRRLTPASGDHQWHRRSSSRGPGRRYSTFVGIAFLVLIIVATLNTHSHPGGGTLGVGGAERGIPLLGVRGAERSRGPLDATRTSPRTTARPRRTRVRRTTTRTPACEITATEQAIRVCDLFNRPLVLSFWFTRGRELPAHAGRAECGLRAVPGPGELPLDRRPRRPEQRPEHRPEHGWTMPVGYDRDGAVSDLYRVGGCPTVAFAYPGGILDFAKAGIAELSRRRPSRACAPASSAT